MNLNVPKIFKPGIFAKVYLVWLSIFLGYPFFFIIDIQRRRIDGCRCYIHKQYTNTQRLRNLVLKIIRYRGNKIGAKVFSCWFKVVQFRRRLGGQWVAPQICSPRFKFFKKISIYDFNELKFKIFHQKIDRGSGRG